MKISILLPYKENFSPNYPGAVSLFVYETTKNSEYKEKITVFGNTNFNKKFDLKYVNIELKKAKDRGHILEGLTVALANIDQIIEGCNSGSI